MKIKITSKIVFISTICFQIIIFSYLLTKNVLIKQNAETNNRIYAFNCKFYDPYNFLKGRYVQLTIQQETCNFSDLDKESFVNDKLDYLFNNEIVYLLLKTDSKGFWSVCGIRQEKPKSGNFIKAKFLNCDLNDNCYFDFRCDEYYMQENFAKYVDTLRNQSNFSMKLEIYSDTNGNILQKQLYLSENDTFVPAEEFIKDKIH